MTSTQRLVEMLRNKGELPRDWADSVVSTDRGLFLPEVIAPPAGPVDRREQPQRWRRMAYADLPLTTQTNDGMNNGMEAAEEACTLPTSSSSQPSLMLRMLSLLDVRAGQRVLELGLGTGYNAALLCHRLGDGNVTSVDCDRSLVEQAEGNLSRAGYAPRTVCGDGTDGCADGGPYERVLATYTVRSIPGAWVAQLVDGGRIVAPWGSSFHSANLAVLEVRDGQATGRFTGRPAFMWDRTARPGRGRISEWLHHEDDAEASVTGVDPQELWEDRDAQFFVGLRLTDVWATLAEADDGSDEATLWLFSDDGSSWATVEYVPGRRSFGVDQYGPRRLWTEAELAHREWHELAAPSRHRFGLTVDADGQHVWLDDPATLLDERED